MRRSIPAVVVHGSHSPMTMRQVLDGCRLPLNGQLYGSACTYVAAAAAALSSSSSGTVVAFSAAMVKKELSSNTAQFCVTINSRHSSSCYRLWHVQNRFTFIPCLVQYTVFQYLGYVGKKVCTGTVGDKSSLLSWALLTARSVRLGGLLPVLAHVTTLYLSRKGKEYRYPSSECSLAVHNIIQHTVKQVEVQCTVL
jgi:hypothetical protein